MKTMRIMMMTVREVLDTYNATTLKAMAEADNIPVVYAGTRKAMKKGDVIDQLEAKYFHPEGIKERFDGLDEVAHKLLNWVRLEGGLVKTSQVRRKMVRIGLVKEMVVQQMSYSYVKTYQGRPVRGNVFEDVMARLAQKGLLFSLHDDYTRSKSNAPKHTFHPGAEFVFIPHFVNKKLPKAEKIAYTRQAWTPTRIEQSNPQLLLRDLYLYWATVRRTPIKLLKTGLVGKKDMKLINSNLLAADPSVSTVSREDETTTLYFLRRFLEEAQLLVNDRVMLTAQSGDFWQKPTHEQIQQMMGTWQTTHGSSSLGKGTRTLLPVYSRARKTLMENVLSKLEVGEWYTVAYIHEELLDVNIDFLFERQAVEKQRYSYGHISVWVSELGETLRGNKENLLREFDKYEPLWVRSAIMQLASWGIVDIGYEGDRVAGLRLSEVGAELFKRSGKKRLNFPKSPFKKKAKEPTQEPKDRDTGNVIVQPSFQILAMGGVPIQTLALLDDVAERVKVDVNAFEYRLTRDSVYRAQEMGMDAHAVKAFLTEIDGSPLPQNIGRSLDEWAAKHERIVFRTDMTLLQTADSDLLNRLINDDKIGKALARPLMADVALVHPKQMKTLTRTLTKQGMMPVVTDARPESADHSVTIAADGTITPIHAVPSLHLRGRLAQIAVAQPDNLWQLTKDTIQNAGTGKANVKKTLAELAKLQVGVLSGELQLLVKRWGEYYGRVAAETITLIQFQDHDTLKELSQHPDLHGLLTPFLLSDKPLATVEQSQLTHVKTILARFGVTVDTMLN